MLTIYNTLGKKLETFQPIEEHKIKFYQCGPTVYWTQHIGNMRAMVMSDLIRRSFEYLGYDVKFVRNYTDFGHLTGDNIGDADIGEDRMEKAARRENLTPQIIADKYIAEFERDIKDLNTENPTIIARATDYVEEMKKMVQELLDKGYAYSTPLAIYFDVTKFAEYTALNGQRLEFNREGEGHGSVDDQEHKRNPQDFAVWFFKAGVHSNALQFWKSPFKSQLVENGEGFPGWHIECSAMVRKELGDTIDIHMGGIEHIDIHHTNEIAQSESANGKKYVNYWLHNEHLNVDGKKMAKSEGTSYSLSDIKEKGFDPIVLRYFFLQAHYRSKQNFTWDSLKSAETSLNNLVKAIYKTLSGKDSEVEVRTDNIYVQKFKEAIEDDFNIPVALSILWEMLKNPDESTYATIMEFDKVLGLGLKDRVSAFSDSGNLTDTLNDEVKELLEQRKLARQNKDFKKSDELRDKLKALGYEVLDGKMG